MDVADKPEIFSGAFNFEFSRMKNKVALRQNGLSDELVENAPNFQIPWPIEPDEKVSELLKQDFVTVIKLQIKEDSLEDVKNKLQSLDHHFLLFSQNIDHLTILIDDKSKSYRKSAKLIAGDIDQSKTEIKICQSSQGAKDKNGLD